MLQARLGKIIKSSKGNHREAVKDKLTQKQTWSSRSAIKISGADRAVRGREMGGFPSGHIHRTKLPNKLVTERR